MGICKSKEKGGGRMTVLVYILLITNLLQACCSLYLSLESKKVTEEKESGKEKKNDNT